MTSYQKPKGTYDILPGDSDIWNQVEEDARRIFSLYGYKNIRTPMFEDYNVFARNVGETSDIVQKEMYDFKDKGDRHITLRPEGTAGVVRSYVENKLYGPEYPKPYKVYYMGPMFRYERPQSGRQREFHQIGVEALNSESPEIDVEVISMAMQLIQEFKVPNIKLVINSLGNKEVREKYRKALISYLEPFYDDLSEDSKNRLYKNPLRILDSKDEKDKEISKNAPSILDYLDDYSKNYFETVKSLLTDLNIKFEVDNQMVRGLDYYNQTIFEIMTDSKALGNGYTTICAGGRYNGLISQLGGPEEGGIGFGLGVERLIILLKAENEEFVKKNSGQFYAVSVDDAGNKYAFELIQKLRAKGIIADKDYQGIKIGKQIKEAERFGYKYYAVFGNDEVKNGKFELQSVDSNNSIEVTYSDFIKNPDKYLK